MVPRYYYFVTIVTAPSFPSRHSSGLFRLTRKHLSVTESDACIHQTYAGVKIFPRKEEFCVPHVAFVVPFEDRLPVPETDT